MKLSLISLILILFFQSPVCPAQQAIVHTLPPGATLEQQKMLSILLEAQDLQLIQIMWTNLNTIGKIAVTITTVGAVGLSSILISQCIVDSEFLLSRTASRLIWGLGGAGLVGGAVALIAPIFISATDPEFEKVKNEPWTIINYNPSVAKEMLEDHPATSIAVEDFISDMKLAVYNAKHPGSEIHGAGGCW